MTTPFKLSDERQQLLETDGPILVLGGPGSGKTSIALLKAEHFLLTKRLQPGQQVLFLSFARATVARVAQHARKLVSTVNPALEINTYHGFAWSILRSHGYLLCARRIVSLLAPPQAAARFAHLNETERAVEKLRLFREEGLLHFDLFANQCADLLRRSNPLAEIVSGAYPLIIVDEFQDTNPDEWALIQVLGQHSTIIALADPEQRIYEFRGADPARIQDFITTYRPRPFDFSRDNHRSDGTDIVTFANDLLTDAHKGKQYVNVTIHKYTIYRGKSICFSLKTGIIAAINRLGKANNNWSIACLVPTKRLMLLVSNYLSLETDALPAIAHDVALDQEGPALAGLAIAGLLEGGNTPAIIAQRLITDLCTHIRGRRGNDQPPQPELELTGALTGFLSTGNIRGKNRQQIVAEAERIACDVIRLQFTGNPAHDWLAVRDLLEQSTSVEIQRIAENARFLRLLTRGTVLRDQLGALWRDAHNYRGAIQCVENALRQEHFSASLREPSGVQIMTIHKSKGKEFDEVLIFEGYKSGKFIRSGANTKEIAQAKLALRVAITRARKRAAIFYPKSEPCAFF